MQKIKWAILGLGRIANKFAQDLALVEGAELWAVVAAHSQDKADEFARRYGAKYALVGYESVIALKHEIDVVYVATPHIFHFDNTMMCLENKINVLCEKPLAMNVEQVTMMIETAQKNNCFLMEAMWTRFMPSFRFMEQLLAEGSIGTPLSTRSDFGFASAFNPESRVFNKALGGGALLDVGIYPALLALSVLGYPETIKATAQFSSTGIDETCAAILTHQNGAMSMLHASVVQATEVEGWIFGTKGSIKLHSRFHHSPKITLKKYHFENGVTTHETPIEYVFNWEGNGYQFEAAEVVRCLRAGLLESPQMNWQMSYNLMRLLDHIRLEIGLTY